MTEPASPEQVITQAETFIEETRLTRVRLIAALTGLIDEDTLSNVSVAQARYLATKWLGALPDLWLPASDLDGLLWEYDQQRKQGADHDTATEYVMRVARFDHWLRQQHDFADSGKTVDVRTAFQGLCRCAGITMSEEDVDKAFDRHRRRQRQRSAELAELAAQSDTQDARERG